MATDVVRVRATGAVADAILYVVADGVTWRLWGNVLSMRRGVEIAAPFGRLRLLALDERGTRPGDCRAERFRAQNGCRRAGPGFISIHSESASLPKTVCRNLP